MTNWRYLIPPDELKTILRLERKLHDLKNGKGTRMSGVNFLKELANW